MVLSAKSYKRITVGLMTLLLATVVGINSASLEAKSNPTLRFVAANHPFSDVIKPLLPEFEKQTGIKVNMETYEENQLTPKLTVEFTSRASTIDVFMTRPLQEGKLFAKNNWYEPLDTYIKKQTPATWDWKDFPASTVNAVTNQGKIGAVPVVTEWQVVFYRKDLFEQAKISPPKTMEELEAAAKKLNNPDAEIYGIVSRGQRGAAVTQFSSYLYNFGGDFIKDGKCVIDSPKAIQAFQYYGRLLKNYGPPGVTNMSWPQAQALFASGKVAMWTDASVLVAGLLDPVKSKVADKVGIALFPAGPSGNHPFMIVPWALSIPNQSKNKEAAWKFVEWASSKEVAKKAQLAGLTMARNSVWSDPEVVAKIHPDLALTAKQTGPIATPYDRPLMTAVVEARDDIGDVIVKAIETGGNTDFTTLTKAAAQKVNGLLEKAGENKK